MKEIILAGKDLVLLTHLAELNGTRVSDMIYKIVFDEVTGKFHKTIKNKRQNYYFNPQKIYDDFGKELDKYISKHEETKRGFKLNRKLVIKWILNNYLKHKEIIVKESIPSNLQFKGGKVKTAKQNEKLMQTSFSSNGEIKTSPISIPKQ